MKLSRLLLFLSVFCIAQPVQTRADTDMPSVKNLLTPCSGAPNCVSTQTDNPGQQMAPLPFTGTAEAAQARLKQVLTDLPRSEIVRAKPGYIAVLFRSLIFGFVDEAEFLIDETNGLIHFRSGARTGYYDFGVNRARMKQISDKFNKN